jgi:hypothetical protein
MNRRTVRSAVLPTLALFLYSLASPAIAAAQGGFVFDEDEVDPLGEPMEFGEDEVWEEWDIDENPLAEPEPPQVTAPAVTPTLATVTAIVVPTDALTPADAERLTARILDEVAALQTGEVVGNDGLRMEFEIMGAELALECAFDPVCLGRYGRDLGLGRVVVGRVNVTESGDWGTTLDLFETGTSSILNYRYVVSMPNVEAVEAALPEQVRALFGVREGRSDAVVGRSGPSTGQKVAAWSTAALAVGSLGAGIAFGLSARSGEDDLRNCDTVTAYDGEPICALTQREAGERIDDGKRDARLSNVFIGTGLMLGVLSTVLFTVTPGSDIDASADATRARPDWAIAPAGSSTSLGVAGHVRF